MIVGSDDTERFINFVEEHFDAIEYIEPTCFDLSKGERVRIVDGVFEGKEGTFVSVSGKQFKQIVVAIEGVLAIQIKTSRPWTIIERIKS